MKKVIEELKDELKAKRKQLEWDTTRIKGGTIKVGNRIIPVLSLEKEIKGRIREIEIKKIEIEFDEPTPANVRYKFETDERYIELKKEFETEKLEELKGGLETSKKMKKEITARIPLNQKRINEIEKKLKLSITEFKKEVDYIG